MLRKGTEATKLKGSCYDRSATRYAELYRYTLYHYRQTHFIRSSFRSSAPIAVEVQAYLYLLFTVDHLYTQIQLFARLHQCLRMTCLLMGRALLVAGLTRAVYGMTLQHDQI